MIINNPSSNACPSEALAKEGLSRLTALQLASLAQCKPNRTSFHKKIIMIKSKKIKIGKIAPDFTLSDQDGKEHSLSHYKGQWALLYFYPKDDTPGCTKEACMIRDSFPDFQKLNIKVLGVSTDSVTSHKKFADKYRLPFTLLADTDKKVVNLYGVWAKKKFMGKEYMGTLRTSFLIDPKGWIANIYEDVKPDSHAEEVLHYLENLI